MLWYDGDKSTGGNHMTETTEHSAAIEAAEEAVKPGKFSILKALKDRAYPVLDVPIFLDEQAALDAARVSAQIDALEEDGEEMKALEAEFEEALARLNHSRVTVKVQGISEGRREELFKVVNEQFPTTTEKDAFGSKTEVYDPKRDVEFTKSLWVEQIISLTDVDGAAQEGVTLEDVEEMFVSLPPAASSVINKVVMEDIRIATAIFMSKADSDFFFFC